MADVYITYGLRETLWVTKLARLLEAEGYTVYWDHALTPGNDVRTDESIQALNASGAVLAIWSESAAEDHWALSDAQRAMTQDKLISVIAKPTIIPQNFHSNDIVLMQDWDARSKDTECYQQLLTALSRLAKPSQASAFDREQERQARQARMKAESARRAREKQAKQARAKLRREFV
ncbi:MAG: hypothetical protein CSB47_00250 [Proteobacteria bacterium]|nr:MAG: hypothetical protein CSB47_00250 [Pseudomonadota bacterium]